MDEIQSSYSINNYGDVFYRMVVTYRPTKLVELGVLNGYSTLHIAKGLKYNYDFYGERGHLNAYDLFEDYEFNNGIQSEVQKTLEEHDVAEFVTLHKRDAFTVHEDYKNESVGLLHVDLSNTGDVIKRIIEQWALKVQTQGNVIWEGGSKERDQVAWMLEYNKPSIHEELKVNKTLNYFFWYGTYPKFPSLTVMYKKRDA